ncbi:NAD(P)H-dependent oxidoreductase [Pseudooceanicola sp. CBS1P-1]|uniref:NAD(P)H-dependent oxidoreductase n=1 Tax=Pseudooceanicola albus TaxID=2692189 RepID=A0A6L7G9N5_9RHOB|nr:MULTISPECIES: NADPH-dependent FMN reductase [Pseudooceanicola]MBT9384420.1 NAD(P)H-dependent oxidoreductase [Pseudooceanicola endophyticus]MXN20679.1 NAD(P)H-dependent oxidoreductase [Pseudooceanicola albus]
MRILALSGSARAASTNSALLRALAGVAAPTHQVRVFDALAGLPVFSPDLEAEPLPRAVAEFAAAVAACDVLVISSPEYVRTLPGGLKNAIDWLVSRPEIIDKPVALLHASHRGDDMLAQLRQVLGTLSQQFLDTPFARFPLMKMTPAEIARHFETGAPRAELEGFLAALAERTGG